MRVPAALVLLLPVALHAAGSGSLPRSSSGSTSAAPRSSAPVVRQAPSRPTTSSATAKSSSSRGIRGSTKGASKATRTPTRAAPPRRARPVVAVVPGVRAGATSVAGIPSLVRLSYDSGRKRSAEADELMTQAAETASVPRGQALRAQALARYRRAAGIFEDVVASSPRLYQAWNQLGYARRKAGEYPAALQAYAMALRQKPGYGPAIEYRAEAHLALGRLGEVKDAYLQLFGSEPELAAELATAIRRWLARPSGAPPPEQLSAFREWFAGREQLAKQVGDSGDRSWTGSEGR